MPHSERPRLVTSRAACRADLAGGTLDIWPLGLIHDNACTVSVALTVDVSVTVARRSRAYVVVQGESRVVADGVDDLVGEPETALVGLVARQLDLAPAEITIHSDSPRGGGLGASSALCVALIAAFEACAGADRSGPRRTSALARDIEAQLMELPTGRQDHFTALVGGVVRIDHQPGGEGVTAVDTDLERLGRSLVVAYSGESHFSARSNWQVIRRRLDGDPGVAGRLQGIADTATALAAALEAGELEAVGTLMDREWSLRRRLAEGVSTPRVEELLVAAREAGAWGGKVCGAGGGGCVVALAPEDRAPAVARAFGECGATVLDARPSAAPLRLGIS